MADTAVVHEDSTEHTGSTSRKLKLPTHPARILVADDEHLVAAGLRTNLTEMGFAVTGIAADGEQAVELCKQNRPDLALLDLRMPKRDGLETAEILFGQMGIPTIMLSAYSDHESVLHANRIGVFGYLVKPVSEDQLRVAITIAWGRYTDVANQDHEIDALKQRLEDRKMIEQAKWLLVQRKNITEPEAMKQLQMQARSSRRTLPDVARSVLEAEQLFNSD